METREEHTASDDGMPVPVAEPGSKADEVNQGWRARRLQFIARGCHEVNRAYCLALGDASQPPWEEAPQWQKDSAVTGVELHVGNPDAGPQASHESWMREKLNGGWVYGPTKNPDIKEHPCLVPFDQLPREQQAKDFIFRAVVHAISALI